MSNYTWGSSVTVLAAAAQHSQDPRYTSNLRDKRPLVLVDTKAIAEYREYIFCNNLKLMNWNGMKAQIK